MARVKLVIDQIRRYHRDGVSLFVAGLKHSLIPLPLLSQVLPESGLVLDLGCGEGMLANLVARVRPGARVVGIDRDGPRLEAAQRVAAPNARFIVADIEATSHESASAIIFNDVLHHNEYETQEILLRNAWSALHEDGVLIVKEVDRDDRADRLWTTHWDSKLYPNDRLSYRSLAEWRECLYACGFAITATHRVRHPWPASRTVIVCRRRPRHAGVKAANRVVFVTGASGFVGRNVVAYLAQHGLDGEPVRIKALVRDPSRLPKELDAADEIIAGTLESLPSRPEMVSDADYVLHLAADKRFFARRDVMLNNIAGTTALLKALDGSTRLKRLVFTSSMGALDRARDETCERPIDETAPALPTSEYGKGKLESEHLIKRSGLPFTILRLPWCYGPGMTPETHVRNLAEGVIRRKLITQLDWPGRVSLLDVRECARALAFAATDERLRDRTVFAAEDEPLRLGSLLQEIGRLTGRRPARVAIPSLIQSVAFLARRFVPFALKSALLDVLWVDTRELRALGFHARERGRDFLVPLLHDVRRSSTPSVATTTALVTGAASGIGRELATQLAADGFRTIWVDRDRRVAEFACAVPDAEAVVADLARPEGVGAVTQVLRNRRVCICVNCAGVGTRGDLLDVPEDEIAATINVNVIATTAISRCALTEFEKHGGGVLLNVASSSAFLPLPGMAVYAATKAYVLNLTEALSEETRRADTGRSVAIAICPSGVKTGFQRSARVHVKPGEGLLDPGFVAARMRAAIRRQTAGTVFIGWPTRVMALSSRVMPRAISARLTGRLFAQHR